jgi:hypothetical protein
VNPLGGTMVADPSAGGFNPYAPTPGAQPAFGAPPQQQPQGFGPPPGAGGSYGSPPQGQGPQGFGPPPGAQPEQPGGYGPPPAYQPPPAQGAYGPPPGAAGGYGPPPGAMQGYGGAAMMPAGGAGRGGPIGKTRNPVMVLVISMLCFVYALIQLWGMLNELKAYRGKDDISPIMFFLPIISIIQLWNLPPKILEAKQMAGVPNAQVAHPILYFVASLYLLPNDLNEIWQAAGGGRISQQ